MTALLRASQLSSCTGTYAKSTLVSCFLGDGSATNGSKFFVLRGLPGADLDTENELMTPARWAGSHVFLCTAQISRRGGRGEGGICIFSGSHVCTRFVVTNSLSVSELGVSTGRNIENENTVPSDRRNNGLPITTTGETMAFRSTPAKPWTPILATKVCADCS